MARIDGAAQHVAAELIDAERMRPAHARERNTCAHLRVAERRPHPSDCGDNEVGEKDHRAYPQAESRVLPDASE